jgi:hypothetical protein
MQGELAGGDPHFDFPAHDFLVLFDGPLQVFVEGAEFGDFAGKAGGLSAEFAGDNVQGQAGEGSDPGFLEGQVVPELIELAAKGGDDAKSGDNDAVGIGHYVELILIALDAEAW